MSKFDKVNELIDKENRTGSIRQTLRQENQELAEMLAEMTPEERRQGRLIGSLLESTGRPGVDRIFAEFEAETGNAMPPELRVLSMCQAVQMFGDDQPTYNAMRKIFFLAKNTGVNPKVGETKFMPVAEQKLFMDLIYSDSNAAFEQAFTDYGVLTYRKKMLVVFRAIELLGIVNEETYKEIRNFFVKLNISDIPKN